MSITFIPTRFQIHVPTPDVRMSMGRGVAGETYDGFGVDAPSDDVFFNAGGKFWAQSKDEAVVQSLDANVFTLAKESNAAIGGEAAAVLGGNGVFIAAGISADPVEAKPPARAATGGFESMGKSAAIAGVGFGVCDMFL